MRADGRRPMGLQPLVSLILDKKEVNMAFMVFDPLILWRDKTSDKRYLKRRSEISRESLDRKLDKRLREIRRQRWQEEQNERK